jgi:hypothetical protein
LREREKGGKDVGRDNERVSERKRVDGDRSLLRRVTTAKRRQGEKESEEAEKRQKWVGWRRGTQTV